MNRLRLALCAMAAMTAGCAITSGHDMGPNGRPVHYIDATSARTAYQKANELCPGGYAIIGMPMQTSIIDHVMTVECKQGSPTGGAAAPLAHPPHLTTPTPAPGPAPQAAALPASRTGKDLFQAERVARDAGCGSRSTAQLAGSGPGFETYTLACVGGEVMVLRCEMGNCRQLK